MCVFLQEDGDISAYAVEQTIHMEKHQETKIKPFDEVDKGHKISVGKASIRRISFNDSRQILVPENIRVTKPNAVMFPDKNLSVV